MTKREFIELTKDMPDNARLVFSSSIYNDDKTYKGSIYVYTSGVKHYPDEDTMKDTIFLT